MVFKILVRFGVCLLEGMRSEPEGQLHSLYIVSSALAAARLIVAMLVKVDPVPQLSSLYSRVCESPKFIPSS